MGARRIAEHEETVRVSKHTGQYGGATKSDHASCAWRLKGLLLSEAGRMDLRAGRLRYFTPARLGFDVSLAELTDVVLPWYYFEGGVKLRAAGQAYRFSFARPNGAEVAAARGMAAEGDMAALSVVASKAQDIGAGRNVGRAWRRLLAGTTSGGGE
jgi:hypothetical protein